MKSQSPAIEEIAQKIHDLFNGDLRHGSTVAEIIQKSITDLIDKASALTNHWQIENNNALKSELTRWKVKG